MSHFTFLIRFFFLQLICLTLFLNPAVAESLQLLQQDVRFENGKFISSNKNLNFDNQKMNAEMRLSNGNEFYAQWEGEKLGGEVIGRLTERLDENNNQSVMATSSFDKNGSSRSKTKCFTDNNQAYCATATHQLCERVREALATDKKMNQAVARNKECSEAMSYSKKLIDAMMTESSEYNRIRLQTVEQDMNAMKKQMKLRKGDRWYQMNHLSNVTTDRGAEKTAQAFDQSFQGLRAVAEIVEMCSMGSHFSKVVTQAKSPNTQKASGTQ